MLGKTGPQSRNYVTTPSNKWKNKWFAPFISNARLIYLFFDTQAEGNAKPSFLSYNLETLNRDGDSYPNTADDIKGAAAAIHLAGSDTVSPRLLYILFRTNECSLSYGYLDCRIIVDIHSCYDSQP